MDDQAKTQNYLQHVLAQVKFKEAHAEIEMELRGHIEESIANAVSYGWSHDKAEKEILKQMGEPEVVGHRLDSVHRPSLDFLSIGLAGVLLVMGLFLMNQLGNFPLQLLWAFLGILAAIGCAFVKPKWIQASSLSLYAGTLALLAGSFLSQVWSNGQPYLGGGEIHIKFVDLSVILFVISLAGGLTKLKNQSVRPSAIGFFAMILPLAIYARTGSLYPAVLFFISTLAMILAARRPLWFLLSYTGGGALLLTGLLEERLFLQPEQVANLANSERHTDFIFMFLRSLSSGAGGLVAAVALCLVVGLLFRMKDIRNSYGQTLMAGIVGLFAVGIGWGLLSNLGLAPMPVTGINFPFLSYGGSLLIAHMALIGVTVSLVRRKRLGSNF